jgi:hypothetical protein
MAAENNSDAMQPDSLGWRFVQDANSKWRWYRAANGHSPAASEEFSNFGRCLSDAIKHGFKPDAHKYSTESKGWNTDWTRAPPP